MVFPLFFIGFHNAKFLYTKADLCGILYQIEWWKHWFPAVLCDFTAADVRGLIEVFDSGIWDDVTEPLPAKRGRTDNGRLSFACLLPDIIFQIPKNFSFSISEYFKGVLLNLWQKN